MIFSGPIQPQELYDCIIFVPKLFFSNRQPHNYADQVFTVK